LGFNGRDSDEGRERGKQGGKDQKTSPKLLQVRPGEIDAKRAKNFGFFSFFFSQFWSSKIYLNYTIFIAILDDFDVIFNNIFFNVFVTLFQKNKT